jgi:glycosyltransferase involved in cell wall biosynthesis
MPYVASADLGVVIYKNVSLNNYLCAPTKLYEYIMARVPVVACDFPVMRELLDEYPIGFVFDSDDPVSIADAVNRFFRTDSAQRDEMARTLGHARQRFNWEHESQELLQLLSPKAVVKYAS